MKYGNGGGCKGPRYSTGKSTSRTSVSNDNVIKVGRSEGLKMSHLSDQAAGMSNKAGVRETNAAQAKLRRGQ